MHHEAVVGEVERDLEERDRQEAGRPKVERDDLTVGVSLEVFAVEVRWTEAQTVGLDLGGEVDARSSFAVFEIQDLCSE